jgi:hypothetical protein
MALLASPDVGVRRRALLTNFSLQIFAAPNVKLPARERIRSLDLTPLPCPPIPPKDALQRTGAKRFSLMSHWFYTMIEFGRPAQIQEGNEDVV